MDIISSTRFYERQLAATLVLLKRDLAVKHECMAGDVFSFLRATFYRWAQQWPSQCRDIVAVPPVLAVGDLHVENFGTWRDIEGRLIWGVNDFDEVAQLPYTNDLVRLATSALVAIEEARLAVPARRACSAVLEGYEQSLRAGGEALVLAERHRWLRDVAVARLKDQRRFWQRLRSLPTVRARPARAARLLASAMPERGLKVRFVHRQAGLGSLGRERLTALADWRGGTIAREAKPLAPSAWLWGRGLRSRPPRYAELLARAVRVPDPFLEVHSGWVVRRLAPDCSRVELESLPARTEECRLLFMMGWETANIHLGTDGARRAILRDLGRRERDWLLEAGKTMLGVVRQDHRAWCKDWWRGGGKRR